MQRRLILQTAAVLALPRVTRAEGYPTKPIRYIVPVAAGGGNDMIARVVTERWGKAIGQNFIVDNQSGGGGVIASMATAHAVPDGYKQLAQAQVLKGHDCWGPLALAGTRLLARDLTRMVCLDVGQ
jgi:tripartite-type tricarboxylate transporter receptor subunit TctC